MHDELDHAVRVLAMDPGSRFLGVAILDVDIKELTAQVAYTTTLNIDKYIRQEKTRVEHYGEFAVRLEYVDQSIFEIASFWRPNRVVHESPYMGERALPYARLTQINMVIGKAINRFDSSIIVDSINPAVVKKNVGVPGNSSDKDLMRTAVATLLNVENVSGKPWGTFTEHEIDASAVGYHLCCYELGLPRRLGKS